ncbi:Alpha-ketoglutarate permease [Helicobacter heilmannii]|uniref:MFS transporter n=1 Tax=Helicobacter heilmannii TaxID=35817 RepID=UPI0006A1C85A|nr:MFS transporter [Helicobacter heilmannii]CRF48170.1 Alpha-ketoglutarate permease [Helicobacter heilmannii]
MAQSKKIRSVVAAASGNLVEWFDFYIYAFSATYFAHSFSESSNPIIQQIQVFGIFAVGFFMRPLGSWIFGSLADKIGRKKSMIMSVVLMSIGSFMIAVLPTKESVGDLAILFLLLARMVQGLSVGGEYGIVATYLSELSSKGNRGFYSSFQYSTLIGGQFLAVASISVLMLFFSLAQVSAFAWRILFVVGGLLALGSLVARRLMDESSSELEEHQDRGTLKALLPHLKTCFIVFVISAGGSLAFYTITTYAKTYLENAGMAKPVVNDVFVFGLLILMLIQPLFGYIGDKISHKRAILTFTILAFFGIAPIFRLMSMYAHNTTIAFLAVLTLFLILSFYTSVSGIFKASLFPEHVRALGTGFSFALGNAVFGGSTPYIALQFKHYNMENGFFAYVAVMMACMFVAAMCLPKQPILD